MTALPRGTPHSQLPASQTAPVAEFRCLYTPDIRKKQKKWQDGYLKFHSFNNRVMVYDQARNFLGDTYYKDSNELHEGDELTLDKGVMVEVADAIQVTQTDLTPLFEKKPRETPPPPSAPPRRFQPPSQVARPPVAPPTHTARTNAQQLRHKSLNTLLGTPKGPIGKAVPIKSPYEARQEKEKEKENDFAVDRAAKRQKTTHTSTSTGPGRLPSPAREERLAPNKPPEKSLPGTGDAETARHSSRSIPQRAPVVTLDEIDAEIRPTSNTPLPRTPPGVNSRVVTSGASPAPSIKPAIEKSVLQTPRIPRGKVPVPSAKALETPKAPAPTSSPPVSASNRLTNVDFAIQAKDIARSPPKQPSPPPRNPQAKSLRLSKGVKRGTLMMCQPPPPPRTREHRHTSAAAIETKATTPSEKFRRGPPISESMKLAEAATMKTIASRAKCKTGANDATKQARQRSDHLLNALDDDREVIYGLMDRQLLVSRTPPPEPILIPDGPEQVQHESTPFKLVASNAHETAPRTSPPAQVPKVLRPRNKPGLKSPPLCKPSPPTAPVKNVRMESRAASPALSGVTDPKSRTASLSPQKLAALSTGGFRKKSKQPTPQLTTEALDEPLAACRNETVTLPPHPLRANKKGPFMTTTELAATLQRPRKRAKAPIDPIEDEGPKAGLSPNRKFRRVRSENDAPIPSTSEAWEKENLPKDTCAAANAEIVPVVAATEAPAVAARKKSGLAALVKKTDPRKKFVRTQSLTVETSMPPAEGTESPMVSPVVDTDIGPWSTEAFDLFDWRPPRGTELET